jgi:hypothetical protein
MPIVLIASVIGRRIKEKCGGEATSASSVPCHRSRCIAPAPVVLVADHMPITAAPRDA